MNEKYKKKVILIINRDDVLFLKPLDEFLKKNNKFISHIFHTTILPKNSNKKDYIIASLRIAKTSYLIKYLLKLLFNNMLNLFTISIEKKKLLSLNSLAKYYLIPCKEVKDINDDGFILKLTNLKTVVVLSNSSQIYQKEILNIENLKFYNFHPSLLPQNKGRFPIFWAILNSNEQGITCHEIDEKIDHGKIINQRKIGTEENMTVEKVMEEILKDFSSFMDESLHIILNGNRDYITPTTKPFYGPIPTKNDVKKYHEKLKNIENKEEF